MGRAASQQLQTAQFAPGQAKRSHHFHPCILSLGFCLLHLVSSSPPRHTGSPLPNLFPRPYDQKTLSHNGSIVLIVQQLPFSGATCVKRLSLTRLLEAEPICSGHCETANTASPRPQSQNRVLRLFCIAMNLTCIMLFHTPTWSPGHYRTGRLIYNKINCIVLQM